MRIEFRDVSLKQKKFALQNITFEVKEGYITGLLGKNGAGKTTLFRTLLDERTKYTGQILIDGKDLREHRKELINAIGVVSEEQNFFMNKSALENIGLLSCFYDNFSVPVFRDRMKEMGLGLGKRLDSMSRGEFLKFQFAFALAHESKLFLLDEATAGMDVVFKKDFFRLLHKELEQENRTVFMSTHIMEEVSQHMDYVARLENGKLIDYYEVGEMANGTI